MFVSPIEWERTVVVEEVSYTLGVVVLEVFESKCATAPRRFDSFAQVFQTV